MINNIVKIFGYFHNKIFIISLKIRFGNKICIGKNVKFRKNINILIEKNGKLIIGDNTFFNNGCSINCMNYIEIGKNNLFGEAVKIYDHNHVIDTVDRAKKFTFGKIIIGNNNWVGSNCVFLKKSTIGNNNILSSGIILNEVIANDLLVKNENSIKKVKIKYKNYNE